MNSIGLGTIAEIDKRALAEIQKILGSDLPNRVKKQGVKRAAQRAMVPVARAARRDAPVFNGFLKKSFAGKAKSYRNGNVTISLVGVNNKKDFTDSKGKKQKPSNYLHLIIKGTKQRHTKKTFGVFGGRNCGAVKGDDFMTPALEGNADKVKGIFFSIVQDEVMKAAAAFHARTKK